jgi:hypothetical protein
VIIQMRKNFFTVLLAAAGVIASVGSGASVAPSQCWALLVGVGDNIQPRNSLYGPNNDVPAVADLLRGQYGFHESHIRRLLNRAATRQNILDGWAWLAHNTHAGDLVVFYYSGHGTVVPERVPGVDPNGLDSALCPFDAVSRSGLIAGWEIGKLIDKLPTNQVVVIVDACNAGHATRDLRSRRRSLNPTEFGMPPLLMRALPARVTPASFAGAVAHKEIYIGAARIGQSAIEGPFLATESASASLPWGDTGSMPNANMGALTYYLLQELRSAAASGSAKSLTYGELLNRTRRDLREEYGDDAQEPQLSGPRALTTPFLNGHGAEMQVARGSQGMASLPVAIALTTALQVGGSVRVRSVAGAALIPGSVLQVGGTKKWTETGEENGGGDASTMPGLVKVTEVSGATATGRVLSGSVPQGFALTEVLRPAPDGRLRVAIGETNAAANRLRAVVGTVRNVIVVDPRQPSDVTLYVSPDSTGDTQSKVDIYRNGIALPTIMEGDLAVTLTGIQRVRGLANLQSAPDSPIHISISSNASDGFAKARIGDKITYRISVDRDAYVTILDLSANGGIVGTTRPTLLRAGNTWILADIPVTAPAGLDTLKVIATTFPVAMDLPANVEAIQNQGSRGKPTAVAQRVLDALHEGSTGVADNARSKDLSIDAATASAGPANLAVNGWACADQLLRIDP